MCIKICTQNILSVFWVQTPECILKENKIWGSSGHFPCLRKESTLGHQVDVERCVTSRAAASHEYLQKEAYLASFCSAGLSEPRATELKKAVLKWTGFKGFFSPLYRRLHCYQIIQSSKRNKKYPWKLLALKQVSKGQLHTESLSHTWRVSHRVFIFCHHFASKRSLLQCRQTSHESKRLIMCKCLLISACVIAW